MRKWLTTERARGLATTFKEQRELERRGVTCLPTAHTVWLALVDHLDAAFGSSVDPFRPSVDEILDELAGTTRIETDRDIWDVLNHISFAPSCVDMGWQWKVRCMMSTTPPSIDGWVVSTTFRRPDRTSGEIATGEGRPWFVAKGSTESGLVKTAFAAAKMILEHELMESFKYRGDRLFDPHHEVDDLLAAVANRCERTGEVR